MTSDDAATSPGAPTYRAVAAADRGWRDWWEVDRMNHLHDLPRFCPDCAADLRDGLAVEYWEADRRVYHVWCRACSWAGDIVRVRRMIGHEPLDPDE